MELSVVETVQQMACDMKLFACNRKPNQAAVRVATALASLTALIAAKLGRARLIDNLSTDL